MEFFFFSQLSNGPAREIHKYANVRNDVTVTTATMMLMKIAPNHVKMCDCILIFNRSFGGIDKNYVHKQICRSINLSDRNKCFSLLAFIFVAPLF